MKYKELYDKWRSEMESEFEKTRTLCEGDTRPTDDAVSKLDRDTYVISTIYKLSVESDGSNIDEVSELLKQETGDDSLKGTFMYNYIDTEVDCYAEDESCIIDNIGVFVTTKTISLRSGEHYFKHKYLCELSLTKFIANEIEKRYATTVFPSLISCSIVKMYKEDKITLEDIAGLTRC